VRSEGVGGREWWRGWLGCAVVVLTCDGAGGWGGYGRVVGTSPPSGKSYMGAKGSLTRSRKGTFSPKRVVSTSGIVVVLATQRPDTETLPSGSDPQGRTRNHGRRTGRNAPHRHGATPSQSSRRTVPGWDRFTQPLTCGRAHRSRLGRDTTGVSQPSPSPRTQSRSTTPHTRGRGHGCPAVRGRRSSSQVTRQHFDAAVCAQRWTPRRPRRGAGDGWQGGCPVRGELPPQPDLFEPGPLRLRSPADSARCCPTCLAASARQHAETQPKADGAGVAGLIDTL
jgi:hypothetical protein